MSTSESLLLDPDFVRDPHAGLERLRNEEPVYYDPHLGWWFVTRYDDVKRMLADPRLSKSRAEFDDYVPPDPKSVWVRLILQSKPLRGGSRPTSNQACPRHEHLRDSHLPTLRERLRRIHLCPLRKEQIHSKHTL